MTTATATKYEATVTAIETVAKDGTPHKRPILVTTVIAALSQYPGRYSVDPDMIRGVQAGDRVLLTLERGKQKQNTDGTKDFHFFYDVRAVVKAGANNAAPADPTRVSIERQAAVKEARGGAEFLMAAWFADTRESGAGGTREAQPLPVFLETFAPQYEALVARLAARFYRAIHGAEAQS